MEGCWKLACCLLSTWYISDLTINWFLYFYHRPKKRKNVLGGECKISKLKNNFLQESLRLQPIMILIIVFCNLCVCVCVYVGGSKIFRTDAVKTIKLTIRPIGRRHPRSSSLPHVDTGLTVSSMFGTHPGSSFLWECQALSAFRPRCPQWYRTGVISAWISF